MSNWFFFDTFFDLSPNSLPRDCEYYFNVLTIEVAVPIGTLSHKLNGLASLDDVSLIKDARPRYMYIYERDDVEGEWEIECTPHTVVEINTKTNEVSWYDMLDFETESPWMIDPIDEDFDYDEDE